MFLDYNVQIIVTSHHALFVYIYEKDFRYLFLHISNM